MANYRAIANGNWSNLAIWEDDSLGYFSASSVLPTTSDDVYANNFTVTIDGTRNASTIRNTAFTPPTFLGAMSIPQMTSNTTPSGTAAASNASFGLLPWFAFDRNTATKWQSSGSGQTDWLSYQFPTGRIIKRYGFFSVNVSAENIKTWTFEGSNNGSTWVVLDTQINFATGLSTFYSFDISANTTSYTYYRINVTATIGGASGVSIASLEMSEITNLYTGISAGGGFTFANGGNLTCTASNGVINRATASVYCLTFNLPSGQSATFNGSVNEVPAVTNGRVILVQNTGTFNIVGDFDVNSASGATGLRSALHVNGSTIINIIGNLSNSGTVNNSQSTTLKVDSGNPIINITGNVSGGSTNTINFVIGICIGLSTSTTLNITGDITTNSSPTIWFNTTGTLNLVGNATGGNSYPAVFNQGTGATIDIIGTTTSGSGYPAIQGIVTTLVIVRGSVINTDTYNAIFAGRVTIDDNLTFWQYKDSTNTINRTLYASGVSIGNPNEDDVREGVDYGPSLELTGTLAVPTPDNVRKGVPTDDTVGTADLTAEDILDAISISTNDVAVRLRNVSTVASTGAQIASYSV
jgi:hypothetical protein